MKPEELLQECEALPHHGRMRRMAELGRLASSDDSIASTIAAFAQGDVYQRILAVQSCFGSRDSELALRGLSDPSRNVRALSLDVVSLICSDIELQTALDQLPLKLKDVLLRHLCRRYRQAPIDTYIETLATRQSLELRKLLPFASRSLVAQHLGLVLEQLELQHWRRLAHLHPPLVVAQLRMRAMETTSLDQRLLLQVNVVLPELARFAPDLALDIVRTMLTIVPLAQLALQNLAQRRPDALAEMVLQSDGYCPIRFNAAISQIATERLVILFTRYSNTVSFHHLRRLSPQQRLTLYTACERGWRSAEGILSPEIIAALPAAQRMQEGRRHLALPILATRPQQRLPYAAFLPWAEARAILDTSLRSPDPDLRGVTLRTLLSSVRYQREHLVDALQLVRQRRNEQDPVRREMLTALAALPYGMWHAEHLEDLAQIIRDALNAADLSQVTARAMERIVIRLLPFHPEWSATQIPVIYRERGYTSSSRIDTYLSDADTRRIAPVLLPVLQLWLKREDDWQLVIMAQTFGRRLGVFHELVTVLEALLDHTRSSYIASSILSMLSAYRPDRSMAIIPRLLGRDKSFITIPPVYSYLHRYRQDLLTPFLGQSAYGGRFSTGLTRFVLPLTSGFYRWTPTQEQLFSLTLLEVANEKDRPTPALLRVIQQLSVMPAIDPISLITLARDERQPVRDTALRALGRLDAGQGIPALLEALNDERARIAIYALRTSLLAMSQAAALDLLRTVSLQQVTVAKEVVRLIGDLSSEAAYRELLTMSTCDNLHRDVRVALLRAFWPYVERAETWEVFMRAARSPEAAFARGVVHIPADGMTLSTHRRLATLITTLLAHPEPEVRMDILQRCTQDPVTDMERILLPPLLHAMNSLLPDECALAAGAVFATYQGDDASLVGGAMRNLLGNRRALQIAVANFLSTVSYNRLRLLPTTRAILANLSEDPLTLSLRLEIILASLSWDEVASALIQLSPELHADALLRAENAVQQAATRPDADLFSLETTLAASSDERMRRLALSALLGQAAQTSGWSDDSIARLQTYREDPSPLVAERAQFTFIR